MPIPRGGRCTENCHDREFTRAFDLDELLTAACAGAGSAGATNPFAERKRVRTTNVIDRCVREVGRRIRSMGVFFDRTSMDRILFAVFEHEPNQQPQQLSYADTNIF
ncbi:MAG: transposase [Stellaceae bacterium]